MCLAESASSGCGRKGLITLALSFLLLVLFLDWGTLDGSYGRSSSCSMQISSESTRE
jgi:hypothetical protein